MRNISIVLFLIVLLGLSSMAEAQKQNKGKKVTKPAQVANEFVPQALTGVIEVEQKVDGEWAQYGAENITPGGFDAFVEKLKESEFKFPLVKIICMWGDKGDKKITLVIKEEQSLQIMSANAQDLGDRNVKVFDLLHNWEYMTSPAEIYHEHQDNILWAEKKYKGLVFGVLGIINKIGKDSKGNAFMELNLSTPVQSSVKYYLNKSQIEDAASLKKGEAFLFESFLKKCDSEGIELEGGDVTFVRVPPERLYLVADSEKSSGNISSKPVDTALSTSILTVSATQLLNEYQSNKYAADEKYKQKTIRISGTITSIRESSIGSKPIINLDGRAMPGISTSGQTGGVSIYLKKAEGVAQLKQGQKITVEGRCQGKRAVNITVDNAVIVD